MLYVIQTILIVLIITLVLASPIDVFIIYNNSLIIKIKYYFLSVNIKPDKRENQPEGYSPTLLRIIARELTRLVQKSTITVKAFAPKPPSFTYPLFPLIYLVYDPIILLLSNLSREVVISDEKCDDDISVVITTPILNLIKSTVIVLYYYIKDKIGGRHNGRKKSDDRLS